jgi:hypothetical protein
MSHYARVNAQGIVDDVIVAEQSFIDSLPDASSWVQTSYRTYGGTHPDGRPLRFNYAGVGFTYNPQKDAFIPPQPYASWVLNSDTCLWQSPIPMPQDGKIYYWDETTVSWKEGANPPDIAVEVLP